MAVRVQVAAKLRQLDELRQLAPPRRLELTRVLPELRRDRLIAEEVVERVLVLGLEDLARLDRGDAVLGDREAATDGVLAHRDVVLLRAGEVLQQIAVRLGWHNPQVETQAL